MHPTITFTIISLLFPQLLLSQTPSNLSIPPQDSILNWLKTTKVPTLGLATIEAGQIKHSQVYSQLEGPINSSINTLFDVASLTKSVTTLLTLRLVRDGHWDLDAPIYPYWIDPDLKDDPRHKNLTSRHLLSHQSGFDNWRRMNDEKKLKFNFDPGTQFGYSGEGFEYLKKAIENKLNTSFEKLCDSLIFQPYGMTNSQLTWNKNIDASLFAGWYDQQMHPYQDLQSKQASAADNLLTTVVDFATFGIAVLQKKGLNDDLFQEMKQPYQTLKPEVKMGLSWVILPDLPNEEYGLLNAGSDRGVNAIILLLPQSQRGLILMTNGDNGRQLIFKLLSKMLDVGPIILQRL